MLNDIQRKLAERIAAGDDITEAAAAANCHRNSYYNWIKLDEFKEYMKELETAAKDEAKRLATFESKNTVKRLITVRDKGYSNASVNASRTLLAMSNLLNENKVSEAAEPQHLDPAEIRQQLENRRKLKVVKNESDKENNREIMEGCIKNE